jgi:hypothetical protein
MLNERVSIKTHWRKYFIYLKIDHIVQCTLIKDRSGTNRFHPKFLFYLSEIKLFLCAAKK